MSDISTLARGSPDRSWIAIAMLLALFAGPLALTLLAADSVDLRNRPSDAELIANYESHAAQFAELIAMLDSDRHSLTSVEAGSIDLAGLSTVLPATERRELYRDLLRQIRVADLRFFPASGKLVLLPATTRTNAVRSSKSYVYLMSGYPQPVSGQHGHYWRGPGMYFVTGDRRIQGPWFIHYDTMLALAVSPY